MSASPSLAPPGSSSYSSGTLTVGDGTWDASRNTFLLPNIQGLNFATMRYNGMGNRFRGLPEYHTLIQAHGVLAAITFLGVVPASILIASFYHPNPKLALRLHISLQVLTVLFATVILVLGYFAVGPERSLTNPHHGIGVAIYVLVLIQAIGGWLIHKIEKGKMRYHIPIKLMLHQWVGRGIALLALAQIPIGLTLYGSPLALFVLYALAMFALLVAYFSLTYQTKKRAAAGYDERGSYVTGTQTEMTDGAAETHHRGRWAALTGALAGGAGLAALRRRRSNRRSEVTGSGIESRADSGSYLTDKYVDDNREIRETSWRNRLLGGAAGLGAAFGIKNVLNRGKDKEVDSELSSAYRPPLGGNLTQSEMHVNRMEEGLPLANRSQQQRSQDTREPHMDRGTSNLMVHETRSRESMGTYSSQPSRTQDRLGPFANLASLVGLGDFFRKRREKNEQRRIDTERQREYENERIFGQPDNPNQRRDGVHFDPTLSGPNALPIPPIPVPSGGGATTYGYGRQQPPQQLPPPPTGPPRNMQQAPRGPNANPPQPMNRSTSATQESPEYTQQASQFNLASNSINNNTSRSALNRGNADTGGAIQQPLPVASPGRDRNTSSDFNDNVDSPPVSVKVKMHNDGRRVTVRRLDNNEAAAERGVRGDTGRERATLEGDYSRQRASSQADTGQQQFSEIDLPSPQRGPYTSSPGGVAGGVNSPGTAGTGGYDTGTDSYDTNRRRRRAERARLEQARQAARGGGGVGGGIGRGVEFS